MYCHNCNQIIPDDSQFCPKCGRKIETKSFCRKCGNILPAGSRFCPSCGASVNYEYKKKNFVNTSRIKDKFGKIIYFLRENKLLIFLVTLFFVFIIAVVCLTSNSNYSSDQTTGEGYFDSNDVSDDSLLDFEESEADENLTAYPVYNGKIVVEPGYECVCPLSVETSAGSNYYVRLVYIGEPDSSTLYREGDGTSNSENDIAFYITGGETVDIDVPIGRYYFYYCSGDTFYGPNDLFGTNTYCCKADDIFEFYTDDNYYQGNTVTLYKVQNGNMSTEYVNSEDFPR